MHLSLQTEFYFSNRFVPANTPEKWLNSIPTLAPDTRSKGLYTSVLGDHFYQQNIPTIPYHTPPSGQ